MKNITLIIGATGKTGMPVVEQALQAGHEVRAVIRTEDERSAKLRSLGAETVIGDVHDIRSVREALRGVKRLYFSYATHLPRLVEATANVAAAAREEGVELIVNMSQLPARAGGRSKLSHHHWLSENILETSGVGTIHVRPSYFMQNLFLFNAHSIAQEGKIYLPYGGARHAPVAAADIARVIVELLSNPDGRIGNRYVLTGPDNLTLSEMAAIIGTEIGKTVEYVDLPAEQWRQILLEQFDFPEYLADHLYNVALDHQEGVFDVKTNTVEELTGKAPQNLSSFAREHQALFAGEPARVAGS